MDGFGCGDEVDRFGCSDEVNGFGCVDEMGRFESCDGVDRLGWSDWYMMWMEWEVINALKNTSTDNCMREGTLVMIC